ncbi:MAG: hypothetical protein KC621_21450, partial [Myxococcales bacterium]|nr:hypothetical protein [Myxococcales bacterium]
MQRKVVILSVLICVFASVVYATLATRNYTAVATVHMMTMAGQEIQAERVVDYDQYNRWNRGVWIATQLDVLESRPVREEILRRYVALGLEDGIEVNDANLRMLATSTVTKVRQGTELLDIFVTTTDPERATRIANLTAHVFEDQSLNQRTDASRQSIDWLNKEISDYDERIREASRRLLEFQRDHQMADEHQQTSLGAVMGSLNEAYGAAHTERVKHETMLRNHERLLRAGDYEELAKDMNTPLIVALTQKYAGAVTEHAQVAAVYGEKMPQRKAAEAQIERIDQELKSEVQHTLAAERAKLVQLEAKENDLAQAIEGSMGQHTVVLTAAQRDRVPRLLAPLVAAHVYLGGADQGPLRAGEERVFETYHEGGGAVPVLTAFGGRVVPTAPRQIWADGLATRMSPSDPRATLVAASPDHFEAARKDRVAPRGAGFGVRFTRRYARVIRCGWGCGCRIRGSISREAFRRIQER